MALGVGAPQCAGCFPSSPVSVLIHIHSAQHASMPLFPKQTHRPAVCLVGSSFLQLEGARRSPAGDAALSLLCPGLVLHGFCWLSPTPWTQRCIPLPHQCMWGLVLVGSSGCFGGCLACVQLNAKIGLSRSQLQTEQSCSVLLPGFTSLNTCALECTFFHFSMKDEIAFNFFSSNPTYISCYLAPQLG